jgi:hypothetical protein
MEDVVAADAMLVSTFGDDWVALHTYKVPCIRLQCKLSWNTSRVPP